MQRNARKHATSGSAKQAVRSEDYWVYKPQQRVMTCDGFPGRVTAVQDGPHAGNEAYEVTLDGGMGGGLYSSSQLRSLGNEVDEDVKTAASDYPEIGTLLHDRPDPARQVVYASKSAASGDADALYLRFGAWPKDERSENNVTGHREEGVSVYDLNHKGEPIDPDADLGRWHEHDQHCDSDCDLDSWNEDYGNDTKEEMNGRVHRAEKGRYNGRDFKGDAGHLVKGEMVGVGHDGEPLLKKVKRVGDWIDHKHLFFPGAQPHRLARDPEDEEYKHPEGLSPHTAMPSKHHPVPEGFHSTIERGLGSSTHTLHGHIGPERVGSIEYSLSDDGGALKVDNLSTYKEHQGKGVGSAMMDELHRHHPEAWINHGDRTQNGLNWWSQYDDPAPERNIHLHHPSSGWDQYFHPLKVTMDLSDNYMSEPTHNPLRSMDSGDYPEPSRDSRGVPEDFWGPHWTGRDRTSKVARSQNGQYVDGHGTAPDGVRAADPDGHDSRSTEGDPDPHMTEPLPGTDYHGAELMKGKPGVIFPEGSLHTGGYRDPFLQPSRLTDERKKQLGQMGDAEANALDPTSDEHEYMWGYRQKRPDERHAENVDSATRNKNHQDEEASSKGHDMEWTPVHHEMTPHDSFGDAPAGHYLPYWKGECKHCGAAMTVDNSSTSTQEPGRDARKVDCAGPGTKWQNDMTRELAHERFQKAISEFGQGVKDNHDKAWLKDQGLEASLQPVWAQQVVAISDERRMELREQATSPSHYKELLRTEFAHERENNRRHQEFQEGYGHELVAPKSYHPAWGGYQAHDDPYSAIMGSEEGVSQDVQDTLNDELPMHRLNHLVLGPEPKGLAAARGHLVSHHGYTNDQLAGLEASGQGDQVVAAHELEHNSYNHDEDRVGGDGFGAGSVEASMTPHSHGKSGQGDRWAVDTEIERARPGFMSLNSHTAADLGDITRGFDKAREHVENEHADDLTHVPDWEHLHTALPADEHDGWMFMERTPDAAGTGGYPAGRLHGGNEPVPPLMTYKHGITRKVLHADAQGNAYDRYQWGDKSKGLESVWKGPQHATENLAGKGHYSTLEQFGETPQSKYDDEYKIQRNKRLTDNGYNVFESAFDPYRLIVQAATDPSLRFHITAHWRDVVAKAKRIRAQAGVRITMASDGLVYGEVKGDHGVYETGIQRLPGSMQSVATYSCGCKWGAYHWGADDDFSRYAGRMCSHALALQYEAQSRGMFGQQINVDHKKPGWVPDRVVVKYDINDGRNQMGRSSSAELSPVQQFVLTAQRQGESLKAISALLLTAGIRLRGAANDVFGDSNVMETPPPSPYGATQRPIINENPASAGFASSPDPGSWSNGSGSMGFSQTMAAQDPWQQHQQVGDSAPGNADDSDSSGAEAELHDEPEGALPETDGSRPDITTDDESLSPDDQSIMTMGTQMGGDGMVLDDALAPADSDEIIQRFQASAAGKALGSSGGASTGEGDFDIAAGARAHLAKLGMAQFSPGEQAALINEAPNVTAANLDRLDIAGTHYAEQQGEEDDLWMV